MTNYPAIGIIGGMGPEATIELYRRIIRIFQREFGARDDAEFPEMYIVNLPIPDVVAQVADNPEVERQLLQAGKNLVRCGVQLIAIPCNSVMFTVPMLREQLQVQVLNIVEEAATEVEKYRARRVGVLATMTTVQNASYQKRLGNAELILPTTEEQKRITQVILNVLSGEKTASDRETIRKIIDRMKECGAEKVILGCTELPLLVSDIEGVVDTLEVLARSIVRWTTRDTLPRNLFKE